jgi:hypothetical protein
MIQLNGVSPYSTNTADEPTLINAAGLPDGTSFQSQLSAALTSTLEQFGINPNSVNLSIAPLVSSASTANTITPVASATAADVPETASAATAPAESTSATDSVNSELSFDAAYWASQPPAVQALQNIDDPTQRAVAASQLAASGYQIDTPIMVWGWDPSKVTTLRQDMGYTWVPSAFQSPVPAAPGLSNGTASYDPNNPPPGSIAV